MRWTKPSNGDIKIKRRFAVFPIRIGNEVRWFEWITVKYVFCKGTWHTDYVNHTAYRLYGWQPHEFIDDCINTHEKYDMNVNKEVWKKISNIIGEHKISYTAHFESREIEHKICPNVTVDDLHIQINLVIPDYYEEDIPVD